MALEVLSVTRINGPNCDHFRVTVTRDGQQFVREVSRGDLDDLFGSPNEADIQLAFSWIRHRRSHGLSVTGVIVP